MFYRIGENTAIALSPENIVTRITVEPGQILVHLRDGEPVCIPSTCPDYIAYYDLMRSSPMLAEELQAQTLRDIRRDHTHPFLDELPPTLFAVFQSLPGSEKMELHLTDVGVGSLWKDGKSILSWNDLQEGLTLLLSRCCAHTR